MSFDILPVIIHGLAGLFFLVSALFIAMQVRINKGAKANFGWMLLLLSLVFAGFLEGNHAVALAGLTDVVFFSDYLTLATAVMMLTASIWWQRLFRKLTK